MAEPAPLPGAAIQPPDSNTVRYTLNGIGPWLVILYLTEIGGAEATPGVIIGAGWRARVWPGAPFRVGALAPGVTEVAISGTDDDARVVQSIAAAFEKKVLRAGG
jgi:hypothetical protein